VTDPTSSASRAATAAATEARVQIRELVDLHDLEAAHSLLLEIWRPAPDNPPVTTEILRAMSKGGGYVAGAFEGDQLVGFSVGFYGPPAEATLHSHIAGVSAGARGRNVGFALKLHQRSWALARGVTTVTWTFDPLLRANAWFNLVKLAAVPASYLPNFYGEMRDAINGRDESDRLLVHWRLDSRAVDEACRGRVASADATGLRARGAAVALDRTPEGGPEPGAPAEADLVLVGMPVDVEGLRRERPELARSWRRAVRKSLGGLLLGGGEVVGYDRAGWYVVRPGRRTREGDR
jgi:predicted GNAT superfamily acetyltransferase